MRWARALKLSALALLLCATALPPGSASAEGATAPVAEPAAAPRARAPSPGAEAPAVEAPPPARADVSPDPGKAEPPPMARAEQEAVPEPEGYHGEPYRAPVPATLRGAEVVGDAAAHALWRAGIPFLDLLPTPVRPANLPAGTLWRDPPHETIPGAIWVANTGYDALDAATEAYFRAVLARVSGGRKDAPMVFFCKQACWMSWNGAKRAVAEGYGRVFWYPDGTDGWVARGGALEPVKPYVLPAP